MPAYDPRIDAYITNAAAFAQPVMLHLRELIHQVCPEVQETMKWNMPHFEYKGLMCGFAAFRLHCTFGFWKSALLADPHSVLKDAEKAAMGSFGKMTGLQHLPSDAIVKALIRDAMRLNDEGIAVPAAGRKRGGKPDIEEPAYITELIASNDSAKLTWDGFPPSHRREYLEWITEAKTVPTREKRLARMMEQLQDGKHRHWKYQR